MELSQIVPGFIRTYVPLLVAWVVGTITAWNADFSVSAEEQAAISNAIGIVTAAAYYALVRWLETRYPVVGKLLGSKKQPVYVSPAKTVEEQQPEVGAAVQQVAKDDHRYRIDPSDEMPFH